MAKRRFETVQIHGDILEILIGERLQRFLHLLHLLIGRRSQVFHLVHLGDQAVHWLAHHLGGFFRMADGAEVVIQLLAFSRPVFLGGLGLHGHEQKGRYGESADLFPFD